jgi:dTMP kinase
VRHSSDGLFVSVDGPSGVGKSTTVQALARLLAEEDRIVHITCEPSAGPIGELARELTETVYGTALACLYAADRYYHLDTEVLPHLDAGEVVI